MLSHLMIHAVEQHSSQIAKQVIATIQSDPKLSHLGGLTKDELEQWASEILANLGSWLDGRDRVLAEQYESLGRMRFTEGVPLHETVYALLLLKDKMVEFVRDNDFPRNAVEIYAEEELEHRVNRFFDWLVFHLVKGYEAALREASHNAHPQGENGQFSL